MEPVKFPHGAAGFRLIPYDVFDPVTNMAIDEALLELHCQGKTPPTLRFYGWEPASISFGYSQRVSPDTVARIKAQGLGVVRRPTGGRAVLHEGELTYSFIGSSNQSEIYGGPPLSSSIQQAYKQICQAFIVGLNRIDVPVELGRADSSYKNHEDCFEATTLADLHYQGKKLVGSAQLRRKEALLQHGSVLIDQGQNRMAELLGLKTRAATREGADSSQQKRHACLNDIVQVDRTTLEEAIGYGFNKVFDCKFTVYDLSFDEWEVVDALKSNLERYRL